MNKKSLLFNRSFSILFVVAILIVGYSTYFNGCTQSKGTSDTMTAEKQKAIEDSLIKMKEFEITKDWSTAYNYFNNKSWPDAKKFMLRVLKMDPELRLAEKLYYKNIHGKLAQCYIEENKPDSTEWAYEAGVKFFPDNEYYHESLGYMNRSKNLFEKSILHYEKAVEILVDEKPELYKTIGDLYYQIDDVDKAILAYESYLKLKPEDRDAQEKYAGMLKNAGREDEATTQKEKLLADNPDDTTLMSDLGRIYYNKYEYAKSLAMYKRLVEKEPENIDALQLMAGSQMNLEDYNGAIDSYKRINSIKPNDVDILCAIADAYRMKNSFSVARTWTNRAISADRNSGRPFIALGDIYQAAAEYCANQKDGTGFDFNDKLVYELAHKEFRKAKKDLSQIDSADRRMRALTPYLPTTEDRFMKPNQKRAEGDCYKWIYK